MLYQKMSGSRCSRIPVAAIKLLLCLGTHGLLPSQAGATYIYTLADANASARIDVSSQTGLRDWTVDGQDRLNQEWFCYRIGSAGPEASIDTISCPAVVQQTASTLKTTYANNRISIQVLYSLTGGSSGSGAASVSEQIQIRNLAGHALDFQFFEYADLDFPGTTQLEQDPAGLFNEAFVNGSGSSVSDTLDTEISPGANHGVAGLGTLCQLNDPVPTTFADHPGPSPNAGWTLEWDSAIAAKGTLLLTQVMNFDSLPVPEPSVLSLMLLGLAGFSSFLKRSCFRT